MYKKYIVKTNEKYVGFVVHQVNDKDLSIYANSIPDSKENVEQYIQQFFPDLKLEKQTSDELIRWGKIIYDISQGTDHDTSNIPIDISNYSDKQKQVISTAHQMIPKNELWPYSRLAEISGLINAQRFVGSTMKNTRQIYIVPVHRVKRLDLIKKINRKKKKSIEDLPENIKNPL